MEDKFKKYKDNWEHYQKKIKDVIENGKNYSYWGLAQEVEQDSSYYKLVVKPLLYDNCEDSEIDLEEDILPHLTSEFFPKEFENFETIFKILCYEDGLTRKDYDYYINKYRPQLVPSEDYFDMVEEIIKLNVNHVVK